MLCRFLFFKTSLPNILSITLISKQLVVWLTALSLDAFDCRMKEFMEGFSVISMKLKEPCDERMVFLMMLRDMCLKDCQMHNGDTDAECVHWQLLYTLFFKKVPWKPSTPCMCFDGTRVYACLSLLVSPRHMAWWANECHLIFCIVDSRMKERSLPSCERKM